MDPQQKQLLQCVYRALEDAGIPMEDASGTRTGVFFGTVKCHKDQIQSYTYRRGIFTVAVIRSLRVSNLQVLTLSCTWQKSLMAFLLQV